MEDDVKAYLNSLQLQINELKETTLESINNDQIAIRDMADNIAAIRRDVRMLGERIELLKNHTNIIY